MFIFLTLEFDKQILNYRKVRWEMKVDRWPENPDQKIKEFIKNHFEK